MRIGCLGAAGITPQALVFPAHVHGGAILQSVAARDVGRAEAFAKLHGFARADADYAALVSAPDIDLIYNALPINLHAPWSIRALEAGKHVLCEKPFAMNADEAAAVLEAARASGRRVVEAFHYRYHPGFVQMLEWIDAGAIGEVTTILAAFNIAIPDRDGAEIRHLAETGGGAFMDLGCYPLSWTLAITEASPIKVEAEAVLTPRGVDERLHANLHFASGVRADLSASMAQGENFHASLTVTGSEGKIVYLNPLIPQAGGAQLSITTGIYNETVHISRLSTYCFQLDALLSALETGENLPTESEAILRQQQALDSIYETAGLRHLRFR